MTIEIPDLTIASAIFFLLALILTVFARLFSRYWEKSDEVQGKSLNRETTSSGIKHQTELTTVTKAVPSRFSDESSNEIRREEHESPGEIQEEKSVQSDAQNAEPDIVKSEESPEQG